ncbi:hypothetical protein CDL12_20683 [Handroanthus impetiginosus]|uniref:Uncharacterized protein n=1 Tax=Handroanthus impetiginosus TaxID=429701 RepID=A0A2G9GN88_9LAMI|nr:hypothetical protein CDL12_20683 [Handroanthus impetiginosus]
MKIHKIMDKEDKSSNYKCSQPHIHTTILSHQLKDSHKDMQIIKFD